MQEPTYQVHTFDPVFDRNSEILILGTFPSVKSRENAFYYGHPQNRFWQVLAAICRCPIPQEISEKRKFLLANKIALWDVIHSCRITGSSDSSIRDVVPNDINVILKACPIRGIFANGKTAEKLYNRYLLPSTGRAVTALPSTSAANASWSAEKLISAWQEILTYRA